MNNYLKGMASLLDLYATQANELKMTQPVWDDLVAIRSDWEKISSDLNQSILNYASEIANYITPATINILLSQFSGLLHQINTVNQLVSTPLAKNLLIDNPILVNECQQNIRSHKELLEKINQHLLCRNQNDPEKETE